MLRTRVGYAGGRAANPTYTNIGDHTETVQIDYDPRRIAYGDLLEIFWNSHDPTIGDAGPLQYRHAVFFHNRQQQDAALASRATLAEKTGRPIRSEVLPLRSFTLAEQYHQKYILKYHGDLFQAFSQNFPDQRSLVDSTAAARINGYLGGFGSLDQLHREIGLLGLRPGDQEALLELVGGRRTR